jgi:hypothetical protein
METSKLTITRIPKLNVLVIKQKGDRRFFISTQESIVIDVLGLSFIIKYLIMNNIMSVKLLEGIIEEYRDSHK